jgi:hypothetical protein
MMIAGGPSIGATRRRFGDLDVGVHDGRQLRTALSRRVLLESMDSRLRLIRLSTGAVTLPRIKGCSSDVWLFQTFATARSRDRPERFGFLLSSNPTLP